MSDPRVERDKKNLKSKDSIEDEFKIDSSYKFIRALGNGAYGVVA